MHATRAVVGLSRRRRSAKERVMEAIVVVVVYWVSRVVRGRQLKFIKRFLQIEKKTTSNDDFIEQVVKLVDITTY